jgi:hypothetical protein
MQRSAGLIRYHNTLIQVLLSCANDLSFQVMAISVSIERAGVSANLRLHRGSSAARRHPPTAQSVLEARGSLNADHAGKASTRRRGAHDRADRDAYKGCIGGAVMPREIAVRCRLAGFDRG